MEAANWKASIGDAMYMMSYSWGKYSKNDRTVEEVEKDIEKLKGDISTFFDKDLTDRKVYSLSHLIICGQENITFIESHLKALNKLSKTVKNTANWQVTNCEYKTALAHWKKIVEEKTKERDALLEEVKAYHFSIKRRELDEEIEEIKARELDKKEEMEAKAITVQATPVEGFRQEDVDQLKPNSEEIEVKFDELDGKDIDKK